MCCQLVLPRLPASVQPSEPVFERIRRRDTLGEEPWSPQMRPAHSLARSGTYQAIAQTYRLETEDSMSRRTTADRSGFGLEAVLPLRIEGPGIFPCNNGNSIPSCSPPPSLVPPRRLRAQCPPGINAFTNRPVASHRPNGTLNSLSLLPPPATIQLEVRHSGSRKVFFNPPLFAKKIKELILLGRHVCICHNEPL